MFINNRYCVSRIWEPPFPTVVADGLRRAQCPEGIAYPHNSGFWQFSHKAVAFARFIWITLQQQVMSSNVEWDRVLVISWCVALHSLWRHLQCCRSAQHVCSSSHFTNNRYLVSLSRKPQILSGRCSTVSQPFKIKPELKGQSLIGLPPMLGCTIVEPPPPWE